MKSKEKTLNEAIKESWNGIVPTDVLYYENGKLMIGGKPVSDMDAMGLQSNAIYFRATNLWKLLKDTVTGLAVQRLAYKSTSLDDVHFGKAMLYEIDVIEKTLTGLANLTINGKTAPKESNVSEAGITSIPAKKDSRAKSEVQEV